MWTELLLHLGIIIALLAVLYYVEKRVSSIEVPQGISTQQFNSVILSIVERQNELTRRYNKIDEYLTEFNKWATVDENDNQKIIEVVENDDPFLVPVSDDDESENDDSSVRSDTSSEEEDDEEEDNVSEITYDEPERVFELHEVYDTPAPALEPEPQHDEEKAVSVVETILTVDADVHTKDYNKMSVKKLKELAKERGIKGNISQMSKQDLVQALTGATTINI